jgi:hypothetical protein
MNVRERKSAMLGKVVIFSLHENTSSEKEGIHESQESCRIGYLSGH